MVVLWITGLYLIVEVIGGVWTGSLALLADAGHMLNDVAGLGLALFAIKMAERVATPEKTYGYYRAEISRRSPMRSSSWVSQFTFGMKRMYGFLIHRR